MQHFVEHETTAQRFAGEAPHSPLQTQEIEREAISQMSFTVAVDLRMRAEHVAQHRGITAHVAEDEQRRTSIDVGMAPVCEQTTCRSSC